MQNPPALCVPQGLSHVQEEAAVKGDEDDALSRGVLSFRSALPAAPERVFVPGTRVRAPASGRPEQGRTAMAAGARVFAFRDARWAPDPVLEPSAAVRAPQPVPLVIDNGSFQTRAGWASADPAVPAQPLLRFRSLAARSRGARGGAGAETQVGNDLGSPEPLRWLLRSPFDRNVPVQMELQELLFDHVFQRLGVASQVPPGRGWGAPVRPKGAGETGAGFVRGLSGRGGCAGWARRVRHQSGRPGRHCLSLSSRVLSGQDGRGQKNLLGARLRQALPRSLF